MTERCPACKQPIRVPHTQPPMRTCAECDEPILRGHRYRHERRDGVTVLVHRVCETPSLYFTLEEAKRRGAYPFSYGAAEAERYYQQRQQWREARGLQ